MTEPEYIDLIGCAQQLGMRTRQLKRLVRDGQFIAPAGQDSGDAYWLSTDVLRWGAGHSPQLASRVALQHWPTPDQQAEYLGPVEVDEDVILRWRTEGGIVGVVWRPNDPIMLPLSQLACRRHKDFIVLVNIEPDFEIGAPSLTAVNTAQPDETYSLPLEELARVLGQAIPYWPLPLRDRELVIAWKPGAATVTAPARPDLDTCVLLRMAAMFPAEHATHRTLLALAQTAQQRSTAAAVQDLEVLDKMPGSAGAIGAASESPITIAAQPLTTGLDVDNDDLDPTTRRIGWAEILSRSDLLSVRCVREAKAWDGGRHFPLAHRQKVNPHTAAGEEWAARLEPITQRTAMFQLVDDDQKHEVFTDPETGQPVARINGDRLLTAVTQHLPATSPLATLILDENKTIWVRTTDGTLYLAPQDAYFGIDWGHPGPGPGSLALLIHRLLDDVNARAADSLTGAPEGLEELTQHRWPSGTVLTREVLEAARDGRPYEPPHRGSAG